MKRILVRSSILILLLVLVSLSIIANADVEPGSEGDPLVTLSFVERRLEQLKYYVDQKIDSLDFSAKFQEIESKIKELGSKTGSSQGSIGKFEVVFVEKGKSVYFAESTEFILRAGQATAIQGRDGGLSDVTAGKDLKTGDVVPLNHLIIVPKNDGRGIAVLYDSYLMIRGAYSIY